MSSKTQKNKISNIERMADRRESRLKDGTQPVFVHSLHRSGSTYIFNAFRRATFEKKPLFFCYQEPFHEQAWDFRGEPNRLLGSPDDQAKTQSILRHPKLEQPYFQELYDSHDYWKDVINSEIIYDDYFGKVALDDTIRYTQALLLAAKRRPLIQECRSIMRMGQMKEKVGGVHVCLLRNPRDQWWSLKVDRYFEATQLMIVNALGAPDVLKSLLNEANVRACPDKDLQKQLEFHYAHPVPPETGYMIAYALFILGFLEAEKSADLSIWMDMLANDHEYKQQIKCVLEDLGISGLDFDDCKLPAGDFSFFEEDFFQPIEKKVTAAFIENGYKTASLEIATGQLDRMYQRKFWKNNTPQKMISDLRQHIIRTECSRAEEIGKYCQVNAAQSQEIEVLRRNFHAVQAELCAIQANLVATQSHLHTVKTDLREKDEYLTRILKSSSWKITKSVRQASLALRTTSRRIRKLFKINLI